MFIRVIELFLKFACIGLATLILTSCGNNEKLSVYQCNRSYDAEACNQNCTLEKDMKFSFLTNKEEKSVLQISYFEGDQHAHTLKNCTIFDKKNWDCSEFDTFPYVSIKNKTLMANGIFTYISEVRDLASGKLRNADEKGFCAK